MIELHPGKIPLSMAPLVAPGILAPKKERLSAKSCSWEWSMKGPKEQQNWLAGQQLGQENRLAKTHCPTKDLGSGLCWCCVIRPHTQWPVQSLGDCLPSSWSSAERDNDGHILIFRLLTRSNLFTFSLAWENGFWTQWLTLSCLNMARFCIP